MVTTTQEPQTQEPTQERMDQALDRLRKYRETHQRVQDNGTDAKIVKMWQTRINKLEAQIEQEFGPIPQDETQLKDKLNQEEEKMTQAPTKSKPKGTKSPAKTNPATDNPFPKCCCGCGNDNNPGSRFSPGHDARLKGMITRALNGTARDTDKFPKIAVDTAESNPDFYVAQYGAKDILKAAGMAQNGSAPKTAPKKSSK